MRTRTIVTLVALIFLILVPVAYASASAQYASAKATNNQLRGAGKVLAQGAPFHGTNGMYFDSDDHLYIASLFGNEIVVMDPNSGRILERLGRDEGVLTPDDLIFGPDGSLYWTSLILGFVGRLSPDGEYTNQSVAPGVNPITFSDTGRLFVALDFLGDGLYELDPSLVNPPRLLIKDLGFLNGFDFGPDGWLYGPIFTGRKVVRINVDTLTVETVVGDLQIPVAVKFDSKGRLHVLDQGTGEVIRVDIAKATKEVVARMPPGLDNLAFDSRDRLFVSHASDGSIYQVLPSGQVRTVSKGGMICPGGVAVLSHAQGESVFVGDVWTVREFDGLTGNDMGVQRDIKTGSALPSVVTVSADGDKLVCSTWLGDGVYVLDPETGDVTEHYVNPAWLPIDAIRFSGDIVFTDLLSGSVRKAIDGSLLATGLIVPSGLAAMGDNLYVADWATGVVWKVVDGVKTPVAEGLILPEGLAAELDGSLLVVESGAGRLSRIDVMTGHVSTVAEDLELGAEAIPGVAPTLIFNGVAVGPSGYIYVTGDIADVLYRIKPIQFGRYTIKTRLETGRYVSVECTVNGVTKNTPAEWRLNPELVGAMSISVPQTITVGERTYEVVGGNPRTRTIGTSSYQVWLDTIYIYYRPVG